MNFSRISPAGRLLLTLLFCFLCRPPDASAAGQAALLLSAPQSAAQQGTVQTADKPPRQVLVHFRRSVGLNRLFVFETSPLGDRTPIILVPGRAEEFQHDSWWKKFRPFTHDDAFNARYKIYNYIYDSKEELDTQAADLVDELKQTFAHLPPERKIILVTYSLGGVIAREAFEDPEVRERTGVVFGIAVPFHGSPLFDPEWFAKYMQPAARSPVRKMWDKLIYRAYLFNKSNLTRGLKWNNFDGSKPQFSIERDLHGDQIIPSIIAFKSRELTRAFKERLIVYASYLENGYTRSGQPYNDRKLPWYVLDKPVKLPADVVGSILPIYGLTVHSVFTYTNNQLANIPSYTPEHPEGLNTNLYRFNDGAIPLSSMLFLPPRAQPYQDDFEALLAATDVRQVRIFVNIDHMHIGGYSLIDSKIRVPDLLMKDSPKRTPHEWLFHDLMNLPGS